MEIFLDVLIHASSLFCYSEASFVISLLTLCKLLISFILSLSVFRPLPALPTILVQDMVVARGGFSIIFYLLFGCPKSNFGPLQVVSFTCPMLITVLFLVRLKGDWEPETK